MTRGFITGAVLGVVLMHGPRLLAWVADLDALGMRRLNTVLALAGIAVLVRLRMLRRQ